MDDAEKSINEKTIQFEVQCWLEEYRSLRALIESLSTSVRYLVIFNLTALGTIGGLVLSNIVENMWVSLIIPIMSPFIGFIVYYHNARISRIENYIKAKIALRLRELIKDDKTQGNENKVDEKKSPEEKDYGVIGWESYIRDVEEEGVKFVKWFSISGMNILTFSLTSVFVLIFTAKQILTSQTGWQITLWSIGLVLTIVLINTFITERELWLGKETTSRKIWNRLRGKRTG